MKRTIKRIAVLFIALTMVLSFTACSSLTRNRTDTAEKKDEEIINESDNYSSKSDLTSSLLLSNNVIVSKNEVERGDEPSTLKVAYNSVKRACVAIYVSTASTSSAGSGTIVDVSIKDKTEKNVFYILTCFHVISAEGANIQVCVPDADGNNYGQSGYDSENYIFNGVIGGVNNEGYIDKTQAVTLVGGNKLSDVAVLRLYVANDTVANIIENGVEVNGIKEKYKAKIIDKDLSVSVTDEIFLVSNPGGTNPGWFTHGYIAQKFSTTSIESIGQMTLFGLNLDAWHGSSGGAVFNLYGEIIGILNSGSDSNSGMNYAIPYRITDDATTDNGFINIMKQLIGSCTDKNYGYVSGARILFGFTMTIGSQFSNSSSSMIIRYINKNYADVPVIQSVTNNSIASQSGLQAGDIITGIKINDKEKVSVTSYDQAKDILDELNIGDHVVLSIERLRTSGSRVVSQTGDITLIVYQFFFCDTENYD